MRQSRHLGMNGMRQYYKEFDYQPLYNVGRLSNGLMEQWLPHASTGADQEGHAGYGQDYNTNDDGTTDWSSPVANTWHYETAVFSLNWDKMHKARGNAIGFKIYIGGWGYSHSDIQLRWGISSINPAQAGNTFFTHNAINSNEMYLQGTFSIDREGKDNGNAWYTFGCWPDATTNKLNLVDNYWTDDKTKFFATNQSHIYLYLWTAISQQNNIHIINHAIPGGGQSAAYKLCLGYMGYSRIKE